MIVTVFFAADKDRVIRAFITKPVRCNGSWRTESDFFMISELELTESEKNRISALTWEDEPYQCNLNYDLYDQLRQRQYTDSMKLIVTLCIGVSILAMVGFIYWIISNLLN